MKILVTGGTGDIGSHTVISLVNSGNEVVIVDNLSNSKIQVLDRLYKITGKKIKFYKTDVQNEKKLFAVFRKEKFQGVIHFAGFKAVGESVEKPLEYYSNNLESTFTLMKAMKTFGVRNLVFSSSATVYGKPASVPIYEDFPLSTTNPYGTTKLFIERILTDWSKAEKGMNIALLRYFNPVGAHESGLIGEDPNGIPNNLVPYITKVAVGKLPFVNVFGDDYDTPDGTGVRDYIHVCDLAEGHVAALKKLETNPGLVVYNLGTGKGYSVLEMIEMFRKVTGREIPYRVTPRRPGDIDVCYASTEKAKAELGWEAKRDLEQMCRDSWNWQEKNPDGYSK